MHRPDLFAQLDSFSKSLPKKIGKYLFLQELGKGGFSRVYLARSEQYSYLFVAKVVPSVCIGNGVVSDRDFLCELQHSNIISLFDSFDSGEYHVIVMENCPNHSIKRFIKSSGFRDKKSVPFYLYQISKAFAFIHSKKIAHRDIKPSNILIDSYLRPKIIDFGIAIRSIPGKLESVFSGSQPYSAPEVLNEDPHDVFKADVWSLGVTFYVLSVGQLPWPQHPQKVMLSCINQGNFQCPKTMNVNLANLIQNMIVVEPELRYTMEQVVDSPFFASYNLPKSSSEFSVLKSKKGTVPIAVYAKHRKGPSMISKAHSTFAILEENSEKGSDE